MRVKFETSKRQYSESFVKQKQKYEKTFKMIIADKKTIMRVKTYFMIIMTQMIIKKLNRRLISLLLPAVYAYAEGAE